MKVVFMGSPEFALPSLKLLFEAEEIVLDLVVTQPPRPAGRGGKLNPTPVNKKADELGLDVMAVNDVNKAEHVQKISSCNPDYISVTAFGQILSRDILSLPERAPVNLHASLLPKYRGASPIQQAIINGDKKTGVTTILMDEGLDTGKLLMQREVKIGKEDTAGSLHDRLAQEGAELLLESLIRHNSGKITPVPQDDNKSSYAPRLQKEDGKIDFSRAAGKLVDFIRGMNPWPGAYTFYQGERLKIWVAEKSHIEKPTDIEVKPGKILKADPGEGLFVAAGRGLINLTELQPAGRSTLSCQEFINGYKPKPGEVLGGN